MKKRLIVLFLAAAVLCLSACGPDISAYADRPIRVVGLLEEEFTITPAQLAELECVEATAVGQTEKAGTVQAWGPTLETFLAQYGVSLDQLKSVRFTATDDYVVTLGRASWDRYDIILSIASGSEPLADYQQPLRIVIPGGESGNWIRSVETMEFTYLEEG